MPQHTWGFRDNTPVDISEIPDTPTITNQNTPVYSREFKVKAALTYLICHNIRQSAERLGFDESVLRDWFDEPWWPTAVAAAREAFSDEITGAFSEIIQQAQIELGDRLRNGDVVKEIAITDKETGRVTLEQVRRPVKAKDLIIIASLAFDKRQIATGNPTAVTKRYVTAAERADRMRGEVKRKPQEAIEGHAKVVSIK